MNKVAKRLVVALGIVLAVAITAGFVAGNVFYDLALNPHADKSSVVDNPKNEVDFGEDAETTYRTDRAWFDESPYYSIKMESSDGLLLNAFTIEQEQGTGESWVVINHGYNSASWMMVSFARNFYERGYNVLLPDARGCGRSEGDYIGMGWHDRLDLLQWVDVLNKQFAPRNIVLFGVSMGGSTVLNAAGETLPENVRAVIEDCGYSSVVEVFRYQLDNLFGLPGFPLMNFTSAVTRIRAGFWLGEGDVVKQVEKSTTPTLFIHGEDDTFVPASMLDTLYEAASCEKERLLVSGAGHGGACMADEELYWGTVEDFLARHLV